MIRARLALLTTLALTGCASLSEPDPLWTGPPPWTLDRDDTVQPRSGWAGAYLGSATCALPSIVADEQPVAVGLYESATLSSAAVGGLDQETLFVTVRIEPGAEPLYLLLTSYESMVWRLTGATDRVRRVVVSSFQKQPETGAPASGVIGVPATRVSFQPSRCLPYFNEPDTVLPPIPSASRPTKVVASYSALTVSLPSGAIEPDPTTAPPTPPGFDESMWSEAARYWPGGVKSVSPALIVSAAFARSYRVLPSQAGLSELIGEGAIVGSCIVKPIAHLPPRMTGAHRADLTLAAGVPVPPGDLGHASLKILQAGERDGDCGRRRP